MTVKELIKELQQYPQEAPVMINNDYLDREEEIAYIEALINEIQGVKVILWPSL
jgi:formyltetrahydrofolate synthetase